jgi:hypothetical protein
MEPLPLEIQIYRLSEVMVEKFDYLIGHIVAGNYAQATT